MSNYKQVLEHFCNVFNAYHGVDKIKLEFHQSAGYPFPEMVMYNLDIHSFSNNSRIYSRSFVSPPLSDGEDKLCELVLEDLITIGIDKVQKDFKKRKEE